MAVRTEPVEVQFLEVPLYEFLPQRRKVRKDKIVKIKLESSLRTLRLCGKKYYCLVIF